MFEIKNIKLSLKTSEITLNTVIDHFTTSNITFERKSNYIIIRKQFIYVLFKPKNNIITHINVTKIPNIDNITIAIEHLLTEILNSLNVKILHQKIDNLTAIYDQKKSIDQLAIIKKSHPLYFIRFNKEKFPGLFLKDRLGTFIIFHTGKVNLVGCQDPDHLNVLFQKLLTILN